MEIYQLKTFVAVAREGSITRASDLLCLSQPAVSAHIRALEESLELTLFDRTVRGMSLTPEGTRLLVQAEKTLAAHREITEEARRIKGAPAGKLRLGNGSHSAGDMPGKLVSLLAERYPDIVISLTHGSSRDILEGLQKGTLDGGFYNNAGDPDPGLRVHEVSRFSVFLAAAPDLVERTDPTDWQMLASLPWIFPTSGTCCGRAAENLFRMHNIRPARIINVDRESVTRTLIAGGVGLGILHTDTARKELESGQISILHHLADPVRVLFACRADRAEEQLARIPFHLLSELAGPVS